MNKKKRDWRKRYAFVGLSVIIVMFAAAIFAGFITAYSPNETNLAPEAKLQPPSREHLLGTDDLGRDVFSRMVYGARISLSVGFVAVIISVVIGVVLGAISGYYGGWVDILIMRVVEIVMCFPRIFLILMFLAFLGPSIITVMVIIGVTGWTGLARLVRAEFLSLKERDYVQAARALGASDFRIIFRHILPNALSPVYVSAILGVGGAILIESALSFLGLGVQIPMASWGNILTSGMHYIESAWWLMLFPGLAILITVLSYNILGEALRDLLDPRLKGYGQK
ncbi:MAG: ABC transporter permease [Candidatus Omnitrophica bacterium]|nr:ABC transporter permease [Candidatus Omnitrophota bacterium]